MKIISWNVNGIRSVFGKGFRGWLEKENPDIVCLQEIKADEKALTKEITEIDGYYAYFNPAKRKGYAGTAVYSKVQALFAETKLGMERFDNEGRFWDQTTARAERFWMFRLSPGNGRCMKKIPLK